MKYRVAAAIVALTVVASTAAAGQSLGELARQEEARRKAIKTPAKVYTNESIRGQAPPPRPTTSANEGPAPAAAPAAPSAAPAASLTTTQGSPAPAAAKAPEAEVKDEAYWRKRMQATRDQLARAQIFAEALQSRINALTTDFVNRDDPAQRAVIASDRQKALAELERVKQEIAQSTKAIAETQEEARRSSVPPGWLR